MTISPESTRVGFIGLGIMGQSMAGHLQKAGYELHLYNRTRSKAAALLRGGAHWHDTPGEVAASSDVVITMVGYPADVEDVYLGSDGIIDNAPAGSYLIDMTTSEPSLAVRIAEAAAAKGLHSLDAPVSGGDVGAKNAKLSIMVGGSEADFAAVRPLLDIMGENIRLQGGPGAGQHTKMCNQIVVAGNMLAVAEGLTYAKKSGLDPEEVLKSIGTGAAQSFLLNGLGPKMIAGDFAPGFFVHHFIKDMTIALKEAEAMGAELPGLRTAKGLYEKVAGEGAGEDGTQALIKAYD
jgi:3-hydroxyisobutyrate dehydrogenase